jgi:hypothetical protein
MMSIRTITGWWTILAMLAVLTGEQRGAAQAGPHPEQVLDPSLEAGVYLDRGPGSPERLVPLVQPAITAQSVSTSMVGAMFGVSSGSMQYRVRGAAAGVRLPASAARFYAVGIDPDSLILVPMKRKGKEREFTAMRLSAGWTSTSGRGPKAAAELTLEKVTERVWSILPATRLKPGEYGFTGGFMSGTASMSAYEFAIEGDAR